jgi:hypothetical protein
MSYQQNTYREPADLHLSDEESRRQVALYVMAKAGRTGEDPAAMMHRLGGGDGDAPNLLNFLGSIKVVRERYASRFETKWDGLPAKDDAGRLRAMPDLVRKTIASGAVRQGETVRHMREWQSLRGSKSLGLLLLGEAEAGKTLHASLLLKGSVLDVDPDGFFVGESVLSMHLTSGTKADKREALGPMQDASTLVVDYMGMPKPASRWEIGIVEFLRMRWEAGRKNVLTFRGDVAKFQHIYGADGWATVQRFCTVLTVKPPRAS